LPCFCCGTDTEARSASSSFGVEPIKRPVLDASVDDHSFDSSQWLLEVGELPSESVVLDDPGPSNTARGEHWPPPFSPFGTSCLHLTRVAAAATGSLLAFTGWHSHIAPSIGPVWSSARGPAEHRKCFGKAHNEAELFGPPHPCCTDENCMSATYAGRNHHHHQC
jgi:hypothetical protein